MSVILLLNGPNLNLLGTREPDLYGSETLADIEARLTAVATSAGHELLTFQSNGEQPLVERVHQARNENVAFILLNPAAFTHSSIALRDALLGTEIPFIEIHLSNIHAREEFRQHSYFSDIAQGLICGLGSQGYDLAMQAALTRLAGN